MKQNKKKLLILIYILLLCVSFKSFSQLETNCGNNFHGVGNADIECPSEIMVTSTPLEGTEGTIISGLVYSYNRIKIIPGYSRVRLIAQDEDPERGGDKKRTRAGTGGKGGGRDSISSSKNLNTISLYPNPAKNQVTIDVQNQEITSISLYNIYGKQLLQHNLSKTNSSTTINITELKQGIYVVKIYLIDGNIITKNLIKQ